MFDRWSEVKEDVFSFRKWYLTPLPSPQLHLLPPASLSPSLLHCFLPSSDNVAHFFTWLFSALRWANSLNHLCQKVTAKETLKILDVVQLKKLLSLWEMGGYVWSPCLKRLFCWEIWRRRTPEDNTICTNYKQKYQWKRIKNKSSIWDNLPCERPNGEIQAQRQLQKQKQNKYNDNGWKIQHQSSAGDHWPTPKREGRLTARMTLVTHLWVEDFFLVLVWFSI